MTQGFNDIPGSNLPAGITEDDLIDLVDGVLPASREAAVIEALRREPRLGLMVKAMRADRVELARLASVRVPRPVGMLDAIEAKLNREALSALVAESEQAPAPIPISSVIPERRGIIAVLAESLWARRLATAASLAIVAGLGYFAVRELVKALPGVPPPRTIAHGPSSTDEPAPDNPTPAGAASARTEVAEGPRTDEASGEATMEVATATPGESAVTDPVAKGGTLTLPEALRLAEAGRLVIRVRSINHEGTLRHLQELSRSSGRETRWRAYEVNALPTEYAALSSPLSDDPAPVWPTSPATADPRRTSPSTVADDGRSPHAHPAPPSPIILPDAPSGIDLLPVARTRVRAVRIVQTAASTQALDDLLKDIAVNRSHSVSFFVLPEHAPADPAPSLDPESVLWWARGSSAWVKRVSVPVVVETRD
ncbi:MAG: hypothetical protein ACK4WH_07770 [Phycisphaerales bacterium]